MFSGCDSTLSVHRGRGVPSPLWWRTRPSAPCQDVLTQGIRAHAATPAPKKPQPAVLHIQNKGALHFYIGGVFCFLARATVFAELVPLCFALILIILVN